MDDYDEDFFSVDRLLMEEGLAASTVLRKSRWEHELVSKENPDLSEEKKRQIVYTLLQIRTGNKLPWGAQTRLANQVGVYKSTINKLFKKAQASTERGEPIDVSSIRKGKCGRKRVYGGDEDWLESCPLQLRGTVRSYAGYLKCSHMVIWRLIKEGVLRAHTSTNHPHVLEENKLHRMKWVLSYIMPATHTEKARFVDMKNTIHIDEKWFFLNPGTRRFYLMLKEAESYRSSKSKNYSVKVIFMAATGRPIYDDEGNLIHDGKYGIWPFVYREQAKRGSNNRLAGTWETKPINKINHEVIRDMLVDKVLPAITEKWPAGMSREIFIQQDNARPHITNNDTRFKEEATKDGFNIQLINQSAQSPDFNVLDLGIFRALQSLQHQAFPRNIDELIDRAKDIYDEYDPKLIRFAWITLQYMMIEALKDKGGNRFKIPHVGKGRLQRLGLLQDEVEFEQHIIDEALTYSIQKESENQSSSNQQQESMDTEVNV